MRVDEPSGGNAEFKLDGRKIWVAGHNGMVGSALIRRLKREPCTILTADRAALDLSRQHAVEAWMSANRPDAIFIAAAKVGGILANDSFPADFIYANLMIEANIIHAAFASGVKKMVFLGSSCIYPKFAPQPIPEEALLSGPLEPTNEWYALAKIAGIKLCAAYRRQHGVNFVSAMPANLYGPGDTYDLTFSHVIPALIKKAHQAKVHGNRELTVWGSGTPRREFLYVDDCADALVHIMKYYSAEQHINVGSGEDYAISDLAKMIADTVGFDGVLEFDPSKPDGTPRKLMSSARLRALGWRPTINFTDGLAAAYRDFLANTN